MILTDEKPYNFGSTPMVPEAWGWAALQGWALVAVVLVGSGVRLGYFQREMAPPVESCRPGQAGEGAEGGASKPRGRAPEKPRKQGQ